MKRLGLCVAMFLCVVGGTCTELFAQAADPKPRVVTEPIELINGKNMDGWYTFLRGRQVGEDPNGVFTVRDGMIRVSGEELGCITTCEGFQDYRLILEFKWGDKTTAGREKNARDSGLLIHSVGKDGAFGGCWKYSIECNIIEGGLGDFIVVGDGSETYAVSANAAPEKCAECWVWQKDGEPRTIHGGRINWFGRDPDWKDVTDFRGRNDLDRPHGEWNRIEVVAKGGCIDVYINGTLVNQGFDAKPATGQIQLQSEGAEIFFRRLTLLPLTDSD
ncbi:MAG: DUF1080 domain-containing protein [Thermoguttaceae bacterium]|nr:DUF1080 domain-containing protein [Thermoguttaceae bacterium]